MRAKAKNIRVIGEKEIPFDFDPNSKDALEKLDHANKIGLGKITKRGKNSRQNTPSTKVENRN